MRLQFLSDLENDLLGHRALSFQLLNLFFETQEISIDLRDQHTSNLQIQFHSKRHFKINFESNALLSSEVEFFVFNEAQQVMFSVGVRFKYEKRFNLASSK